MKGVPGFIFDGSGGGRVARRPDNSQSNQNDADGRMPGRFPPKQVELGVQYAEELRAAVGRRGDALISLIDSTAYLSWRVETLLEQLRPLFDLFPVDKKGDRFHLKTEVKNGQGRPGRFFLYLRKTSIQGETVRAILGVPLAEARAALGPVIGRAETTKYLPLLDQLNTKIATISRLALLKVPFEMGQVSKGSSVPDRWVAGLRGYSKGCAQVIAGLVDRFDNMDVELNHLVFEFNAMRGNVRYRSIICRQDFTATDKLGPTEPKFRVITFLSRVTGKRRSKDIQSYKEELRVKALRVQVEKELGRVPTADELEVALRSRRARSCSPWITAELISHCRLGRHTSSINAQQNHIAVAMEPWREMRQLFQDLIG